MHRNVLRYSATTVALLFAVAGADAQQASSSAFRALRNGTLNVWVPDCTVHGPRVVPGVPQLTPGTDMPYTERTPSTLGQSASTFGTAASNVGEPTTTDKISAPPAGTGYSEQTSGSFGQASSDTGQVSSDHGQTAGSFGRDAASVGTASSNYGHDAGTFGHSLSTIDSAGHTPAPPPPTPPHPEEELRARLGGFPSLRVQFASVGCSDLQSRLRAAHGTSSFPDVLLGTLPPAWRNQLAAEYGATSPGVAVSLSARTGEHRSTTPPITAVMLRDAPHPETARALLRWLGQ